MDDHYNKTNIGFNNQPQEENYLHRLSEADQAHMQRIQSGLAITADISRADILLCGPLNQSEAQIIQHGRPHSVVPLYDKKITGQTLMPEEQPLLFRSLRQGYSSRGQRQIVAMGAPIIQQVYPIFTTKADSNSRNTIIGALLIETTMIAHQRHRRRHRDFRQAVRWLQQMCLRGELADAHMLSEFSLYDGVYLIDAQRRLSYMSGIATNLFRSIGLNSNERRQLVSTLEKEDERIVEKVFRTQSIQEKRQEIADRRVWVRKAIPIRAAMPSRARILLQRPWSLPANSGGSQQIDAVLVMVHNATEAVQKERELNVKSAIIQELHHRVKNNLQTVTAILRMQSRRAKNDETRQQLNEAVHRIFSMSVIHEFLSQNVSGPNIRLLTGQATTTSLVVNELLLNALEHGLHGRQQGKITIELADLGDQVKLIIEDDGHGLPPDFDLNQGTSLGLQILHTLVTDDLKGTIQMITLNSQSDRSESTNGTQVMVQFPKGMRGWQDDKMKGWQDEVISYYLLPATLPLCNYEQWNVNELL